MAKYIILIRFLLDMYKKAVVGKNTAVQRKEVIFMEKNYNQNNQNQNNNQNQKQNNNQNNNQNQNSNQNKKENNNK